ncbi:GDSL esterase/lipase [Canna indica]|uniref:GDSL esterase/lipase n=1 Tax=Canna indica TaxID=4628 RepID=A0AAQ3Q2G5_9LILI|nr:GDSL esterase/lipase [Canna indica]
MRRGSVFFPSESLNTWYLSPYMEPLGSDFSNGANFAIAGSKTRLSNMPFALAIQVMQFRRFKMRSLELIAQGAKGPIDAEGFQNALYAIDIGQNDLSAAFYENASYAQVIERILSVIHEIRRAIMAKQDEAFRVLAIGNIEVNNAFGSPLSGCIPEGVRIISVDHPYVLAGLRNGILLCLEWPTIPAFL